MDGVVELVILRDFCSVIWKTSVSFRKSASLLLSAVSRLAASVTQVLVSVHPCRSVQAGFHFRQSTLGYSTRYLLLFSASASRTCPEES